MVKTLLLKTWNTLTIMLNKRTKLYKTIENHKVVEKNSRAFILSACFVSIRLCSYSVRTETMMAMPKLVNNRY